MQRDTLETRTVYHKRIISSPTRVEKLLRALKLCNSKRLCLLRWKRNSTISRVSYIKVDYNNNNHTLRENKEIRVHSPVVHRSERTERLCDMNVLRTTEIREVIKEVPIIKKQIVEVEVIKEVEVTRGNHDMKRHAIKSVVSHIEKLSKWIKIGMYFRRWKKQMHEYAIQTLHLELSRKPKEVIKQVPVVERVEVIKEVPVIQKEYHEVEKEVPVVKKQIVEVEVIREVIKEVPVIQEVFREVIKEVPVVKKEVVYIETQKEMANLMTVRYFAIKTIFRLLLKSQFAFIRATFKRLPSREHQLKLLRRLFSGLTKSSQTFRKLSMFNRWREVCRRGRMLYLRGKIFSKLDGIFVNIMKRKRQTCFTRWKAALKKKTIDISRIPRGLDLFQHYCQRMNFKRVALLWLYIHEKRMRKNGLTAIFSKSSTFVKRKLRAFINKWRNVMVFMRDHDAQGKRVMRSLKRIFLEKYVWEPLQAYFYRWKAYRPMVKIDKSAGLTRIGAMVKRTFMRKLVIAFMRWRTKLGILKADDYELKLKKKVLENLFKKSTKMRLLRSFLAWKSTEITYFRPIYYILGARLIKKSMLEYLWGRVIWKIKISTRGKIMNHVLHKFTAKWQDTVKYYYSIWQQRVLEYRTYEMNLWKEKEKILKRVMRGFMKSSEAFMKVSTFNKWRDICRDERMSMFKGKMFSKLDRVFINRYKNKRNRAFYMWKQITYKRFDLAKGAYGLTLVSRYCKSKHFELVTRSWYLYNEMRSKNKGITAIFSKSSTFLKRRLRFVLSRWHKITLLTKDNDFIRNKTLRSLKRMFLEKYYWSPLKTSFNRWRMMKEDSMDQIQAVNLKLLSSLYSRGKTAMTRRLLAKYFKQWSKTKKISGLEIFEAEKSMYRYFVLTHMKSFFYDMQQYGTFRFLRSLFSKNSKFHKRALKQAVQQWMKIVVYYRFQDESSNLKSCLFVKTLRSKADSFLKNLLRRKFSHWRSYMIHIQRLSISLNKGCELIRSNFIQKALNVTIFNYKQSVKKCAGLKSVAAMVRKTFLRKLMLAFMQWKGKMSLFQLEEYQMKLKRKVLDTFFKKSVKMQILKAFLIWKSNEVKTFRSTYYILGTKLCKLHAIRAVWDLFVFRMKFAGRGKKVTLLMLRYASKWQDHLKLKYSFWKKLALDMKMSKKEAQEGLSHLFTRLFID
jgi:hypothetical protein